MKWRPSSSVIVWCLFFVCQLNTVVAMYQWQCSTAGDGTGNLPGDVSPSVETLSSMAVTTFTPFMAGIVRIYQVPQSVLTGSCSGTVTAIEYCYQFNNMLGVIGRVFTFYKLSIVGGSGKQFDIEDRFEVWSQRTADKCHSTRCCDRFDVPQLSQFSIGDSSFTFGVLPEAISSTTYTLLRFFANNMYGVNGYQVTAVAGVVSNSTSRLMTTMLSQNIPFLRFIIGSPDSSTTTESTPLETTTASESTTTMPPNVDTEPPPTTQANLTTDTPSPDDSTPQQPTTSGTTDPPSSLETTGSSSDDSTTNTPQQPPTSGATDHPSTLETTGSSPGELAGDGNSVGIAVGVTIVGLTAIIVVVVVVIIIVVFTMKRRDKKIWKLKQDTLKCSELDDGITNAMYLVPSQVNSGVVNNTSISESRIGFTKSSTTYDDVIVDNKSVDDGSHEYSIPDEIHNPRSRTRETGSIPHGTNGHYSFSDVRGTNSQRGRGSTIHYMVPANDENSLYAQFSAIKITCTLKRSNVKMTDFLGSGQFGKVHKGVWQSGDHEVEVAVKTLKEGSSEIDKVKFLQEAAIMGQFSHPNVVKLYGMVTTEEPMLLVLELLAKGDLRNYLIGLRDKPQVGADEHTLLSYCRQVASGMSYLANKAFVHRDLAARNILVAEDDVCKIADFGMSRDLEDETYYVSHGGKIPVKWTAPEALNYKKYSTASDVWSFGCVMYEIWSLGHKPFESYTNQQTIGIIEGGFRLPPPTGCPRGIYEVMVSCWHPLTFERPSFNDLMQKLSMPDTRLLKWSDEDKAVHPEAGKIGAELEHALELYKDLQTLYTQEPSQYEVPKTL